MSTSTFNESDLRIKEEILEDDDSICNKSNIIIKQELLIDDYYDNEDEFVDDDLACYESIDNSNIKHEEFILHDSSVDNDPKPYLPLTSQPPDANTTQGVEYVEEDPKSYMPLTSQPSAANTTQTGVEYVEEGARKIAKFHKCPQCSYKTIRRHHMVRHVNNVHSKYKCSQCQFRAADEVSFKRHKILKHPLPKPHQCPDCQYKTMRKYDLKRHRFNLHSVVHPHQCKLCDFKSESVAALDRHITLNHIMHRQVKNVQAKENIHHCSKCDYKSAQLSKLKRHVLAKHRPEKWMPYHCPDCSYKTANERDMKRHTEANHQDKETENTDHLKNEFHQCSFCEYNTAYRHNMIRHVKSVHGRENPFQCLLCEFIGKDSFFLKQHMMTEHPEKKSIVNKADCDAKTPYQVVLSSVPMSAKHHVDAISNNEQDSVDRSSEFINYECSHCDFKTTNSLHLNRHTKAVHTIDMPYQCSQCGFRAPEAVLLEKHVIATHLTEKNYQCPDCSFKTTDVNEMNKHTTIIHPSDNLHQCEHCNYCNENQQDLEKHIFSNHTDKKNDHISDTTVSKLAEKKNDESSNHHNNGNALETEKYTKALHQVDKLSVLGNTLILNSRGKYKGKYINKEIMIFQCIQCEYKIKNPHHLARHVKANHANVFNLKEHIKNLHGDSKLSVFGYTTIPKTPPKSIIHLCSRCEFQTSYPHMLMKHAVGIHSDAINIANHIKNPQQDIKRSIIRQVNILDLNRKTTAQSPKDMIHQCLKCEYKTKRIHHLTRHVKAIHAKKNPLKCSQCSFTAVETSSLKRHMLYKHITENIYHCVECNFEAIEQCDLKRHVENHKAKNNQQQPHQSSDSNNKSVLFADLTPHADEDLNRCQDGVIKTDSSLLALAKPVTANLIKNEIHQCPFCEFKSIYNQSLKRHLKKVHPKKKAHMCLQCKFKASTVSLLNRHVMAKHRQECSECDYKTSNEGDMKKHTESNHQEANTSTASAPSQSNYSPESTNDAVKPISTAHTTNKCIILKNRNSEEKGENDHNPKTSEDTLHKCSKCEFKTAYPDTLNKHLETCRTKGRSLQCQKCQYKGPNFKLLRQHIKKTHSKMTPSKDTISNNKIIPTPVLDKIKKDKSKIKGMIIKSNTNSLHCNQCDYDTGYISNMRRHEKAFHKSDKVFHCPMCNYKAIQLRYLQAHVVTKHV